VFKLKVIIISSLTLGGCASSSDLKEMSDRNAKAGRYYESIGQPQAAQREYKLAAKHKNKSEDDDAFWINILWEIITGN